MKNLFIAVEYEVSALTQTLPDGSAELSRTLKLYSIKLANGMYSEAVLTFDSRMMRPGTNVPQALIEYSEVQPGVHHINARLPIAEFEHYYNIVRSEAPIGVMFEEEVGQFTYRWVGLTTAREPSGEGDSDSLTRPVRQPNGP
jgi:hypothetical protein